MPLKIVPHLQSFMDSVSQIFWFYYHSPKKGRELHGFADIFDGQAAYHSSGSQKTRWVASRHSALLAFEKNFAITVKHLEHVGTGTSEDATKARGMVKAIKTEKFVRFLYFLLHVTKILRELSLQFQSDYLFITEVSTKLETALTKLEGLKDSDPLPIAVTSKPSSSLTIILRVASSNVERTVILMLYWTRGMQWGCNKHFLTF